MQKLCLPGHLPGGRARRPLTQINHKDCNQLSVRRCNLFDRPGIRQTGTYSRPSARETRLARYSCIGRIVPDQKGLNLPGTPADLILEGESRGGRVHVTGIGNSEHIARYVASLLSSTGTPSYFLHATECIHGSAGQVCPSDVIIAISNSGTTPELLSAVEVLSKLGIKIIAVSGDLQSPLAELSDVVLYAGVDNEGGALNLVPRASILAKIYVLCSLSVALESHKGLTRDVQVRIHIDSSYMLESHKGLTREQYAQWHPGGALGRRARGE